LVKICRGKDAPVGLGDYPNDWGLFWPDAFLYHQETAHQGAKDFLPMLFSDLLIFFASSLLSFPLRGYFLF